MSEHTFVYKIGVTFPELAASEILPLSDLDQKDGFIHVSTKDQVPGTVSRFFKDQNSITLLKIRLSTIAHKTRWESSSSHGVFPHIYGDLIGSDIDQRKTYEVDDASQWERILSADTQFLN